MGVPFLPCRSLVGTDTFVRSGAKVVEDPFTGKRVCLVPAVNPDVAIIHVNQADEFGNCRIFGPSVAPLETAMASKRVIVSTEELIPGEDIRKDPGRTTIPYYLVSAVVHAPYGAHPGTCPGLYAYDAEHLDEFFAARSDEQMQAYVEKYVLGTRDHAEYVEAVGGEKRMLELRERETITEGYYR
jgi:glutaconate CoA-transferase subunit A